MVIFFSFFFSFLCRRDRSRTCLVCCHFSFDVAPLHEMPSVSFHLNLENAEASPESVVIVFSIFYSGRLFAFSASSTCRSLQIQCQGKGDEIINIYRFFSIIILAHISA